MSNVRALAARDQDLKQRARKGLRDHETTMSTMGIKQFLRLSRYVYDYICAPAPKVLASLRLEASSLGAYFIDVCDVFKWHHELEFTDLPNRSAHFLPFVSLFRSRLLQFFIAYFFTIEF